MYFCYFHLQKNIQERRSTVLTKEDMEFRRAFEEPVTYNHRSTRTMHAYNNYAPWTLVQNYDVSYTDKPLWTGAKEEMGSTRGKNKHYSNV